MEPVVALCYPIADESLSRLNKASPEMLDFLEQNLWKWFLSYDLCLVAYNHHLNKHNSLKLLARLLLNHVYPYMDKFNFVHDKNYFNCFLVTVAFYYTIFDKILKIFLFIFDIFKRAGYVPLVHSTKNQPLYIMR